LELLSSSFSYNQIIEFFSFLKPQSRAPKSNKKSASIIATNIVLELFKNN
jgi:hypothetical protein